jgi:RNA recognition motif-containing protein
MCIKFGEISECRVYYHPTTKRHLGLGSCIFEAPRSARDCCQALNHTTKMGITMNVFIDILGTERKKMIEQICVTGVMQPSTETVTKQSQFKPVSSVPSSAPVVTAPPNWPSTTTSSNVKFSIFFNKK